MADKVNMSLDEIIGQNKLTKDDKRKGKTENKRNSYPPKGRFHGSASRGTGSTRRGRPDYRYSASPQRRSDGFKFGKQYNTFRRSSDARENIGDGKLIISNLEQGVNDSDMEELFSEFGTLVNAKVHYDSSGKSRGSADVHFQRKFDAIKAMKQYNNVPLDGKPMKIELVTSSHGVLQRPRPNNKFQSLPWGSKNSQRRSGGRVEKNFQTRRGQKSSRGRHGRRTPHITADKLDKELEKYNAAANK